ncbi:hypothetical protein HF259_23540 [Rhizobium leguminosarum]|nr:hypothetical protein [Rhizobium leguminosarum]
MSIVSSNRYYDLIENGLDLAIRTRQVEADSSITIRRLGETRRLLAASPEYLQRRGSAAPGRAYRARSDAVHARRQLERVQLQTQSRDCRGESRWRDHRQ